MLRIKISTLLTAVVCALIAIPALAERSIRVEKTAQGDSAKNLVQALKLAGVDPRVSPHQFNYVAQSIDCHTGNAYDDGLMVYDCALNRSTTISGASAKLLHDAMFNLKMPVDAAMSQTHITAQSVNCLINTASTKTYLCRWQESGD